SAERDMAGELGARLGAPVFVENDVDAAALGAHHVLAAAGDAPRSLAYLNLGTGLACGVVTGRRLWRGAAGAAGEVGHVPVDPEGAPCPCGQRGGPGTVAPRAARARTAATRRPLRGGSPGGPGRTRRPGTGARRRRGGGPARRPHLRPGAGGARRRPHRAGAPAPVRRARGVDRAGTRLTVPRLPRPARPARARPAPRGGRRAGRGAAHRRPGRTVTRTAPR